MASAYPHIETGPDRLLQMVSEEDCIGLSDAANRLGVTSEIVLMWAKSLHDERVFVMRETLRETFFMTHEHHKNMKSPTRTIMNHIQSFSAVKKSEPDVELALRESKVKEQERYVEQRLNELKHFEELRHDALSRMHEAKKLEQDVEKRNRELELHAKRLEQNAEKHNHELEQKTKKLEHDVEKHNHELEQKAKKLEQNAGKRDRKIDSRERDLGKLEKTLERSHDDLRNKIQSLNEQESAIERARTAIIEKEASLARRERDAGLLLKRLAGIDQAA